MGICTCTYNPQIITDDKTLNIKIEPSKTNEHKDNHLLLINQRMINKTFQGVSNINKQNLIDNSMINDALIIHHSHSALLDKEHSVNDSKKSLTSLNFNKRPILAKLSRKRSNQG